MALSHIETGRLLWEERGALLSRGERTSAASRRQHCLQVIIQSVASIFKLPCIPNYKGACTKGAEHTCKMVKFRTFACIARLRVSYTDTLRQSVG